MIGFLIEHYAGKFPVWLAPEQVRVIPITDDHNAHCKKLANELYAMGFRAEADLSANRMNAKIREAQQPAIRMIPNWSDENTVSPVPRDENPFRATHCPDPGTFLIQYSGRMGRTHGLERLLEAAEVLQVAPEGQPPGVLGGTGLGPPHPETAQTGEGGGDDGGEHPDDDDARLQHVLLEPPRPVRQRGRGELVLPLFHPWAVLKQS